MSLVLSLLLIAAVVFQWLTQEVNVKILGPLRVGFHRDEWPAFFWSVLALEVGGAAFFLYEFLA